MPLAPSRPSRTLPTPFCTSSRSPVRPGWSSPSTTAPSCGEDTPPVARVDPAGPATVPDFHRAGGLRRCSRDRAAARRRRADRDRSDDGGQPARARSEWVRPSHAPRGGPERAGRRPERRSIRLPTPGSPGAASRCCAGDLAPAGAIPRPAASPRTCGCSPVTPGASTPSRPPTRPFSAAASRRARRS